MRNKSIVTKPKGFVVQQRPTAKLKVYTGSKVAGIRQSLVVHASASR